MNAPDTTIAPGDGTPTRSFLSWLFDHRGHVMDGLTCAVNLLLLGTLAEASSATEITAGNPDVLDVRWRWILLGTLIAYMVGAGLKRAPLHARVTALPDPVHTGCLCVAWFVLHFSLCVLAAAMVVTGPPELPNAISVAGMALLSTLPTVMAVRVLIRPRKLATLPAWRRSRFLELVADALIGAAVLTSTWLWNEEVAALFLWDEPQDSFGMRLGGALLATGAFAMFYIAPRFLFLIEDHHRWWTWITMGVAVSPLLARILL